MAPGKVDWSIGINLIQCFSGASRQSRGIGLSRPDRRRIPRSGLVQLRDSRGSEAEAPRGGPPILQYPKIWGYGHVKTTVEIADSLFAEAKALAQRRGITIRQLIEDGLRASLKQHRKGAARFQLQDGSFPGEGRRPELNWPDIRKMIYEGRGE